MKMNPIADCEREAGNRCASESCGLAVKELPPSIRPRIEDFEAMRDRVLRYENENVVRHLALDLMVPEDEARAIFADTVRFLFLCGALHGPFAPAPRIDFAWHTFLLFTKDYSEFCRTFFGSFIHHRPRGEDRQDIEGIIPRTKSAAKFCFGELSANWHHTNSKSDCGGDLACAFACEPIDQLTANSFPR